MSSFTRHPTITGLLLMVAALAWLAPTAADAKQSDDWPRFRGPQGTGVSETAVPTTWGPDKNIKWKTAMPGAGVSSPIVVGDKVFVTCYSGYGETREDVGEKANLKRHIVCVDRTTGKQLWVKTLDGTDNEDDFGGIGVTAHGFASHTPVSDGKSLFVFLGKGGVVAYDLDGNKKWSKTVGDGSDSRKWGSASSPVVHGDLVIIPALAESRAVFALNKETGDVEWECPSIAMDNTWATPLVVKVNDDRTDIVLGVPDELWAINPKTGKLAWAVGGVGGDSFYTSAIENDGVIYASVGGRSGGGTIAIRSGGKKDVSDSHVKWRSPTAGSFATPVIHEGNMFVIGRGGVVQVVDLKTGEKLKSARLESTEDSRPKNAGRQSRFGSADYGSPVIAGGKLYYTKGNGETFVMTADANCEQVAVNKLTDDKEIFSGSPAIAGKTMLIRSNKFLYCVGE